MDVVEAEKIDVILATDCGSTTSKARLFKRINGEYRFVIAGEAPTTVESPYEDVTLGVRNAVREIEELLNCKLLSENGIITPSHGDKEGVDLYVTTSSAGGGLQMVVSGIVKSMTAESAERAALGAGAIVMDILSIDDGRRDFEKIQAIRFLRPDMVLFAGAPDGGNISHLIDIANWIKVANPKPRLGAGYQLPIIYAGNKDAQERVAHILKDVSTIRIVDNIRPKMSIENTEPARNAIHEFFMEHVMSHAPGYNKLMKWTPVPIMPTPAAEGTMFQVFASEKEANLIGVGLGGATTNIYSIYGGRFVRSVSANLGMSYSICNVLRESGPENIKRWLPFEIDNDDLADALQNKMIRPTTIPHTLHTLIIEHAVAREAIRGGFRHHKSIARPLLGVVRERGIGAIEEQVKGTQMESYIDMIKVDYIGGTGGLLSHAPRRVQAALILMDAFEPEGVTMLFQDSVFMIPHLGVLSTVHRKAALEIFEKDCIIKLGTAICFRGQGEEGSKVADITITQPNGETLSQEIEYGQIKRILLEVDQSAKVEIRPTRRFDVGKGSGNKVERNVEGGVVGIIIDSRGRPLTLPEDVDGRIEKLLTWFEALDAYPKNILR